MRYVVGRAEVVGGGLVLLLAAARGPAAATESPQPVSPGGATDSTLVEARCPTFSWAGSAGAAGYRLAVLRLGLNGQPEPPEPEPEPEMVALIDLPADSRSFTPPVGRCLDRGERYAWSVAAVAGEDEPVHWSPVFLFEIETGFEPDDAVSLQQAVEVLEGGHGSAAGGRGAGGGPRVRGFGRGHWSEDSERRPPTDRPRDLPSRQAPGSSWSETSWSVRIQSSP